MDDGAPTPIEFRLPPALAAERADRPDLDPRDRVHLALDAGFEDSDFTQEEAARLAGMSARRLRYVLAAEGTSYRAEIDKRRMRKAEQLLVTTGYLVSAVASLCGYRNASAFCHRFKATHQNMTPARYRVGMAGRPKRAGGPTGATKRPAERAQARRDGTPGPSMRREGPGPGESAAFNAGWDHGVRQTRAFGILPRHGGVSIAEISAVRWKKRRRGVRK